MSKHHIQIQVDTSERGKIKVPASALVVRTHKFDVQHLKYLSKIMRFTNFTGKESIVVVPDWEIEEFGHFWANVEEEAVDQHKDCYIK